jgi:hypothetical protein
MKAFHEWREVKVPTFCTSDIGHFFVVGDLKKEEAEKMKVDVFHRWGEVDELGDIAPALLCQDYHNIWIVGGEVAADLGGWGETSIDSQLARFRYEREEGGPYLPGLGPEGANSHF